MSTAAPLQTTMGKPLQTAGANLILQRKCACGGVSSLTGECAECGKKKIGLQAKLRINEPGDVYEQEADRVAEQVLAKPAHTDVSSARPRIQRYTGQATGQADTAPASVDRVFTGHGRPLDPALRQDMEQRFGHDFSRVRVHSGGAAGQSAREVNAHAYTVGRNIAFDTGRFAPGTHLGRRLIAHELTHVVQQSGGNGIGAADSNEKRGLSPISHPISHIPLLVAQRQPSQKAGARKGNQPAPSPTQTDDKRVEACLLEAWRRGPSKAGFGMANELHAYVMWHVNGVKVVTRCSEETSADLSTVVAVWKRVTQRLEDEIIAELVRLPGIKIGQWQSFVEINFDRLESQKALTKFKDRAESQLVAAYADVKVAEAVKGSRRSAEKLKSLADIQIRQILVNHRQDYFAAVSNGVNGWHAPRVPPDNWPSIFSGGSSIAGGIASIVSIGTGAIVAAVVFPLAIVGIGLGIASAWSSIKNAEGTYRQQLLEDAIHEETLHGFERKVEMIEATEDALAVVLAVDALKEGIDLKNIARAKLRAFCWEKMFAKFPEDQSKGRHEVQTAMSKELDAKLAGAHEFVPR